MTRSQFTRPDGRTQSPSPNWVCDVCRAPIVKGAGFIGVENEAIRKRGNGHTIKWRAMHGHCADDHTDDDGISDRYLFYTAPTSWGEVARLEQHLDDKTWPEFSDWTEFTVDAGRFENYIEGENR